MPGVFLSESRGGLALTETHNLVSVCYSHVDIFDIFICTSNFVFNDRTFSLVVKIRF